MIKISDFKKWEQHFNYKFYEVIGDYFKKFKGDKRHNRIYFKLKVLPSKNMSVPHEISDYMNWFGYPIIDYKKGLCEDKYGREIRIGKLFTDLGRQDLLKIYSESKQSLKNTDNLLVVISRHPYDIIGMSTGRGWSTCHDLNDQKYGGKHLHGLKGDLGNKTLVAYLIRDNDLNINNPISRVVIRKSWWDINLYPDQKCYGTIVPEFQEFVNKWTEGLRESRILG